MEEHSIDEAFAEITELRKKYHVSYVGIAQAIKTGIKQELGIGITLGFSLTKVLAKVASKHEKPDGFTVIPGRTVPLFLRDLPVETVREIGHATTNYLSKLGARTALEFARLPETMAKRHFTKPGREIWMELRGKSVYRPQVTYWATGVVLLDLMEDRHIQYSLFESPVKIETIDKIYEAADFRGKSTASIPSTSGHPTPSTSSARADRANRRHGHELASSGKPSESTWDCRFFM